MSNKVISLCKIYAYLNSAWVDLSDDVISDQYAKWGMSGGGTLDRVAETGALTFTLNNVTGKYAPGNAAALAGWKKGIFVKLVITYDGGVLKTRERCRFLAL